MVELKVGDLVVTTISGGPFYSVGDIGTIICLDEDGHYWVDFNGQKNAKVYGDGVWCVPRSGMDLLLLWQD